MISGASEEELEIANARAKVISTCGSDVLEKLDKVNEEYEEKLKNAINDLNFAVDNLSRDLAKKNNIINKLEKYIHDELILDFYNNDMPCELIINKMEKMIEE